MSFMTARAAAKDQARHKFGLEWHLEEPTQMREAPWHDSPVEYQWRAWNDRLVVIGKGPGNYLVQFAGMGAGYTTRGATVAEAFEHLSRVLLESKAQLNDGLKEIKQVLPALPKAKKKAKKC